MTLKQTDIDETMLVELMANNSSKIKIKLMGESWEVWVKRKKEIERCSNSPPSFFFN